MAVDAVLTSSDPDKACASLYVTQHYLEVAYGGKQGCVKAQAPGSAAKSVRIEGVIRPDTASTTAPEVIAKVVPSGGGLYEGEKITVSLVRQGAGWKVDGLKSNAPVGP
jgi:hypothetical protein